MTDIDTVCKYLDRELSATHYKSTSRTVNIKEKDNPDQRVEISFVTPLGCPEYMYNPLAEKPDHVRMLDNESVHDVIPVTLKRMFDEDEINRIIDLVKSYCGEQALMFHEMKANALFISSARLIVLFLQHPR